jgi:hypothetical protein
MGLPVYTKKELKDLEIARAKEAQEAARNKELNDLKARIEALEAKQSGGK